MSDTTRVVFTETVYWAADTDCAVHNEPAMPNGPCDCGSGNGRSQP